MILNIKNQLYARNLVQFANCAGIGEGADYDCDNPLAPGVNQRLILFNLADIDTITYDVTESSIITDIALKTGTQAYAFQGVRQSLTAQYEFVPQTVSVGYDHQVNFQVFDISQSQKDNLEALGVVKTVAIVENVNAPGNGETYFEVYGPTRGLEPQTMTRLAADLETAGSFSIELKTSDNEGKESKMPNTWFDTDYATTLAKVEALLTPAP